MSEEEDLAVLIYKSSKTAKARAAAAAAKDKKQKNVAPAGRRTSTRKRYASQDGVASMDRPRKKRAVSEKRQSLEDSQKARGRKGDWRKYAKICSADECTNIAKKGGVCKRHGAKVEHKKCSSARCTNRAKSGGVCIRHGAKVEYKRCRIEGCMNHVIKGGVCVKHGAKVKLCSYEGCTNKSLKGGVCIRHGAKVKRCSSEGCTNKVLRGGVCWRHGAYRTPTDESTAFGSEFDKTTAADLPHQSTTDSLYERSTIGVPREVVVCREIVEV